MIELEHNDVYTEDANCVDIERYSIPISTVHPLQSLIGPMFTSIPRDPGYDSLDIRCHVASGSAANQRYHHGKKNMVGRIPWIPRIKKNRCQKTLSKDITSKESEKCMENSMNISQHLTNIDV